MYSGHVSEASAHVPGVAGLCGLVAQWITRPPTERKIPGSSPGEFDKCFALHCLNIDTWMLLCIMHKHHTLDNSPYEISPYLLLY